MTLYRRKPVEVEAIRWTGQNNVDIAKFSRYSLKVMADPGSSFLFVVSPEGRRRISVGDWLLRDESGEFDACSGVMFERTYESIAELIPSL